MPADCTLSSCWWGLRKGIRLASHVSADYMLFSCFTVEALGPRDHDELPTWECDLAVGTLLEEQLVL